MQKPAVMVLMLALLLGSTAAGPTRTPTSQYSPGAAFDFGLIGDLGYTPGQETPFRSVFDDLNAATLAFVVHDGDLWGAGPCTDERYAERLALFQSSAHPLIYTPGDNDWTDCHGAANGSFDPLERLAMVRRLFFSDDNSLGGRTLALIRQSGKAGYSRYRENARWNYGEVTFVTLHLVGSNNNLGRTPENDAEYAERNAANIAWLREGFEAARRDDSRGIMLIMQANIFPEFPPFPGNPATATGFAEFRTELLMETIGFEKPVVLVHGDSHYFRTDKPLRTANGERVDNFTRVETFGQPSHHWVQASVDYADPNLFVFRQRIVEPNRTASQP